MQADLLFQLSSEEFEALRSQFTTSNEDGTQIATGCGVRRYEPGIVTEHGAPMAATMLRSQRAVKLSIYLVPAFEVDPRVRPDLMAV